MEKIVNLITENKEINIEEISLKLNLTIRELIKIFLNSKKKALLYESAQINVDIGKY